MDSNTLDHLLRPFGAEQQAEFRQVLNAQLSADAHDMAVQEKLDITTYCFDKTVNSVVMQIPDTNELHAFRQCVRKFARVKMRAITYYHKELHGHTEEGAQQYLIKNLRMLRPLMRKESV